MKSTTSYLKPEIIVYWKDDACRDENRTILVYLQYVNMEFCIHCRTHLVSIQHKLRPPLDFQQLDNELQLFWFQSLKVAFHEARSNFFVLVSRSKDCCFASAPFPPNV
ncbi:hypothetical protein ACHAWX_005927 [Stephanocyclus meneghinianus]